MDRSTRHQQRLAGWRERHPRSAHRTLDLDALEALKSENDALARRDMRERPEVCASYPTFVTIGNTHKCNLTCKMCFKQLDDADNMTLPEMGLECFEALAHELFPHVRMVALSVSGEPLVSRSLFDELDLLATYGVRASVTTNGMPLHRAGLIERLLPALHTLTVSMDGADEPVFNSIRSGASFAKVVRTSAASTSSATRSRRTSSGRGCTSGTSCSGRTSRSSRG
jgi:sulfatase maturation enzyme AslB (radical SAM superfamily)